MYFYILNKHWLSFKVSFFQKTLDTVSHTVNDLAAVILQLPASFMAKQFFGFELDNTERFRLTVLAKFPVYVVVYVVEKFGLSVNFWVNLILQLAMIALVLNFYRKDDAEYDIVS